MLVVIPEHLRKLEIIDDLARLLERYKIFVEENDISDSSLDYFYYSSSTTAVRRFLEFYLIDKKSNYSDFDNYISYLENRFFAAKGTLNVFKYLRELVGLDFSYSYTTSKLSIKINDLATENTSLFDEYLQNLLTELLYFDGNIDFKSVSGTLIISGDIQVEVAHSMSSYLEQDAEIL